ncbi:hypothetical protein [Streptomyces sp. NPDC012746]|uniref:hypothetical protein n=1 Tax=Streptomyces sp. NPDC012746 TaxID=3364845 RepID=UPI00369359CB
MTTAMNDGRQADTECRRTRVQSAITAARRAGTPLTAAAIAHAARVDRTFLYRHRDLLDALHTAAHGPAPQLATGPAVTLASLQADPANSAARSARLATLVWGSGRWPCRGWSGRPRASRGRRVRRR